MTSVHNTIFIQFSRQIFCFVMENFSVEELAFSLLQVKALSEVCVAFPY